MRIFAIMGVALAVLFGWHAGGPDKQVAAVSPAPKIENADWRQPMQKAGTVTIPRGWNGHFMIDGDIEGTSLRFVIDTGATSVAIGREDARRIGIDPATLDYSYEARTASGSTRYAAVTLPRVRIGDIQLLGIRAAVIDVPEIMPLLGQSFLGQIDKVSIEGDKMVLTKR